MKGAGKRMVWTALAVLGLSLATITAAQSLLALDAAPSAAPGAAAPRFLAQPVRVSPIAFTPLARSASYTGTLRPYHEVTLGFRLPGKVITRLVEVGDTVTAGQLLARLDDADVRLDLQRAEAEAEAARVDLQRAAADRARAAALFAEGHIAQAALDRAISGQAQAQARSDSAQRALDIAANRLAYTRLVADAAGVVTATPAESGTVVSAGQPILQLARTGRVDAVFALPEQDRAGFASGTATAALWGIPDARFPLTLRDISPDVDPAGRTYRVRMTLTQPDPRAVFGRTVTITLAQAGEPPVASVPLASVVNDGGGAYVWRVDAKGAAVERVAVEVVSVAAEVALIRGDLAAGARIVSLGAHKIDPARPIRVVETYETPEG